MSVPQGTKLFTDGAGVGVDEGFGVAVIEDVGVGVGLGEPAGNGFGTALIVTPLLQTSFFPDLTHVNFLPAAVAVAPALVHLAPALTAAKDGAEIKDSDSSSATRTLLRVIAKRYQGAGKN